MDDWEKLRDCRALLRDRSKVADEMAEVLDGLLTRFYQTTLVETKLEAPIMDAQMWRDAYNVLAKYRGEQP
jgi:hypothetical protein